eukprot:45361-Prymnesium_polylepis.1
MNVVDIAAALLLPVVWSALRFSVLLCEHASVDAEQVHLRWVWLAIELSLLALLLLTGVRCACEFGWRHSGELSHMRRRRAQLLAMWLSLCASLKLDVVCSLCLLALSGSKSSVDGETREKLFFFALVLASLPLAAASMFAASRGRRLLLFGVLLPALGLLLPAATVMTGAYSPQLRDDPFLIAFVAISFFARGCALLLFPLIAWHSGPLALSSLSSLSLPLAELPQGANEAALDPKIMFTLRMMSQGSKMLVTHVDSQVLLRELASFTEEQARRSTAKRRWRAGGRLVSTSQPALKSPTKKAMRRPSLCRPSLPAFRSRPCAATTTSTTSDGESDGDGCETSSAPAANATSGCSPGAGGRRPSRRPSLSGVAALRRPSLALRSSPPVSAPTSASGAEGDGENVGSNRDSRATGNQRGLISGLMCAASAVIGVGSGAESSGKTPTLLDEASASAVFLGQLFSRRTNQEVGWYAGVRLRLMSASQKHAFVSRIVHKRARKRGFVQLMDDARTLRWGWKEYLLDDEILDVVQLS